MINIGEMNQLKVARKSDLGYMLSDGKETILMHFKESHKELAVDEEVAVFVYTDKENRKTATMNQPYVKINGSGFVQVINVMPSLGVFIHNNTPKDVLISKDYLPYDEQRWPQIGDTLFCSLKIRKESLMAKPLNRFDILEEKTEVTYAERELVDAFVIRIAEKGLGLITKDRIYVFVPLSQFRGIYRLGQEVKVSITKMLNKECYGTLNEHKEILMDQDKELILQYLHSHQGMMKLTAKSSAEEVEQILQMSRKAFKRAYGSLYKDKKIDFDEEKTFLTKETQ